MNSSASCLDLTIRSTVWHCTQFKESPFESAVPGMLCIHSEFVS